MSQFNEGAMKAFVAGAAIEEFALVKLVAGKLAAAGLGDAFIGTIWTESFADGDVCNVHLRNAQGTTKCVAAGVFTAGVVYGAAAGRISDVSAGAVRVGTALHASAGAGNIVEVMFD